MSFAVTLVNVELFYYFFMNAFRDDLKKKLPQICCHTTL